MKHPSVLCEKMVALYPVLTSLTLTRGKATKPSLMNEKQNPIISFLLFLKSEIGSQKDPGSFVIKFIDPFSGLHLRGSYMQRERVSTPDTIAMPPVDENCNIK